MMDYQEALNLYQLRQIIQVRKLSSLISCLNFIDIFCAVSRGGQIAIGDTRGGMKVYHGAHKCRTPFKMRRRRSLIEVSPELFISFDC